jgi:hypothetical protein
MEERCWMGLAVKFAEDGTAIPANRGFGRMEYRAYAIRPYEMEPDAGVVGA